VESSSSSNSIDLSASNSGSGSFSSYGQNDSKSTKQYYTSGELSNYCYMIPINIFLCGNTISIIEKVDYLHDHFKLILNYTSTFVGYKFNAEEKNGFLKMLKDSDKDKVHIIGLLNNLSDTAFI
jgi:hypothetical protein